MKEHEKFTSRWKEAKDTYSVLRLIHLHVKTTAGDVWKVMLQSYIRGVKNLIDIIFRTL